MDSRYTECTLCPRECHVNRQKKLGFCGQSDKLKLALAAIHYGEEPPLVGLGGSGTLFFTGCQLACPFCQNHQISRGLIGKEISADDLAKIMVQLQDEGAININLVSATQYLPHILDAIKLAKTLSLSIPIIYNSGGYEEIATLTRIKDDIRIYLPDLKTLNPKTAKELYNAKDYPQKSADAILFMVDQLPLIWEGDQVKQGVIVRHLVLPGYLEESYEVLKWFSTHLKDRALLSLLTQYTPVTIPGEKRLVPDRYLTNNEDAAVLSMLQELNIEEGFFQDLVPGSDWLPNFEEFSPFKEQLARTIWHA